ncbi:phosphotransferase enzyme family protein [Amorphus sp. MBR-141]
MRLINLSENATFLVTAPGGWRSVLRVHRVGYHARHAIESELAWMDALRSDAGVPTPPVIASRSGARIVDAMPGEGAEARHLVMFEFVDGCEPGVDDDLSAPLRRLGEISARLHLHAMDWSPPPGFERLTWDEEAILGSAPTWGHWRDGPNVDAYAEALLARTEDTIRARLRRYGKGSDRYGLIHADVRLANLLIHDGETRVIDFDDSGWGWFLYDVATAFSFVEDHPSVPEWTACWLEGYRSERSLSVEDEREIPTFIMLRRLALLGWLGSHAETDIARELAPHFASVSCLLAETYLARFG